jgi:hypothetical protein
LAIFPFKGAAKNFPAPGAAAAPVSGRAAGHRLLRGGVAGVSITFFSLASGATPRESGYIPTDVTPLPEAGGTER